MDDKNSYSRTRQRLEEIVTQVKAKDLPLEKSLDLYEEALRLGKACAEMIDHTDFSAEELAEADVETADDAPADPAPADDAPADPDDLDADSPDAAAPAGDDSAEQADD
ncbi:MAG: exodeoxyribonuclease VII small subunit [Coriobacteriales bacterium]|jgi:exodeoxyribonuclease VII small subunit|nr:exodeoxyribonuclease VII small subunit [Coriobacteriales bacterium]